MKSNKVKISMVVPCFNEEGNVRSLYDAVEKAYKGTKYAIELVFVDDGSKDKTLDKLKEIEKISKFPIKILSFSRNFGKESVLFAGLKAATGDYTVLIDADMQQPPILTLKMAEILDNDKTYDCVCYYQDSRIENKLMSFVKGSFYKVMNKMSDVELKQGASDFRMFRKNVREALLSLEERCRFTKGIFSWVGFNTYYLPYTPEERQSGTSKWSVRKLIKYAFDGIISFSTKPLKIATFLGLLLSVLSVIYLIVVVIQKLCYGIDVPGYATIITCILLIGGIQLFCIGIIGEYISKLYIEIKQRPIYIVKEKIENDKENS